MRIAREYWHNATLYVVRACDFQMGDSRCTRAHTLQFFFPGATAITVTETEIGARTRSKGRYIKYIYKWHAQPRLAFRSATVHHRSLPMRVCHVSTRFSQPDDCVVMCGGCWLALALSLSHTYTLCTMLGKTAFPNCAYRQKFAHHPIIESHMPNAPGGRRGKNHRIATLGRKNSKAFKR